MTSLRLAARRLARRPVSTALVGLLTGATLAAAGLIGLGLVALSALDQGRPGVAQLLAFVEPELSPARQAHLATQVAALSAVESAELISPEALVADVRKTLAGSPELVDGVDPQWMPPAIDITPVAGAMAMDVIEEVEGMEGISDIRGADVASGIVSRLRAFREVAEAGGWSLLVLLVAAACALISGIAGLQAQRSQGETDLMRIFGATEVFVRLPLVLEGALVGGLGGFIACAAVAAAVASLRAALGGTDPGIAGVPIELPALWAWGVFLACGPCLGALGAAVAAGSADRPAV